MKRSIHWIGGVRHPRGICLQGGPCCCWGDKAEQIAADESLCTRDPQEVTCKPCLRLMRKDDHAARWDLPPEAR